MTGYPTYIDEEAPDDTVGLLPRQAALVPSIQPVGPMSVTPAHLQGHVQGTALVDDTPDSPGAADIVDGQPIIDHTLDVADIPHQPRDHHGHHGAGFMVDNVRLHFYRTLLLRLCTGGFALGMLLMLLTPLEGLVLVTSTAMVIYWLRDNVRFQHGGDIRRCINRDCALVWLNVAGWAVLALATFDIVALCVSVSHVGDTDATSRPTTHFHRHLAAHPALHAALHALAIGGNIVALLLAPALLYTGKQLQRILTDGNEFANDAIDPDS